MADKFQVGFTKVFLKEETRSGLEQLLNSACQAQIVVIQAAARGRLARNKANKIKKAYNAILKRAVRKIMRQRLMNLL